MATFVLVHGAWHGGWCWRRVVDRLAARGHRAFAPTLTGVGERSHLLDRNVRLRTHVDDVVNLIRWEELDGVVLVGHSYGGFVVSGVAEQIGEKIGSLVFLDAFVPEHDQAMLDCVHPDSVRRMEQSIRESEGLWVAPISAAAFKVNAADAAWVDAQCGPHPYQTFVDKIALTGARDRVAKRAYVRAAIYDSPIFRAYYDRFKDEAGWRTFEIPSGHDVMLDAPDALVTVLEAVA